MLYVHGLIVYSLGSSGRVCNERKQVADATVRTRWAMVWVLCTQTHVQYTHNCHIYAIHTYLYFNRGIIDSTKCTQVGNKNSDPSS